MVMISALLVVVGGLLFGIGGVIIFTGIALAMNIGSYWFSADIVLKSSHAVEIERSDDPHLYQIIEEVADRSDMPMPRVYIINSPQPNAFATGRNPKHAAVAVTTGIRELLTDRELRGVLGHELAHVGNRDILTSSIVATMASAISMIGFIGLFFGGRRNMLASLLAVLVAPMVAGMIQMGISRAREYEADADGARIVGDPGGAGLRAGQARRGRAPRANGGAGVDGAPVHREPVRRCQNQQAVRHPPARSRTVSSVCGT